MAQPNRSELSVCELAVNAVFVDINLNGQMNGEPATLLVLNRWTLRRGRCSTAASFH